MGPTSLSRNESRQHRSVDSHDNSECQDGNPLGVSYSGTSNITVSGSTCKIWSEFKVYAGVGDHNFCRNPDGDSEGVWCFTTDPEKEREYCSVPNCDCQRDKMVWGGPERGVPLGRDYDGLTSSTVSGRTCQVWARSDPHDHRFTDSRVFPELGDHNYCRNPDRDSAGVWCFTTDPYKIWEYCSVPRCEQTCQEGFPLGVSYSGNLDITVSGISCQAWSASQPHEHTFTEVGEHNHCRNPNGDLLGAWCFTTD